MPHSKRKATSGAQRRRPQLEDELCGGHLGDEWKASFRKGNLASPSGGRLGSIRNEGFQIVWVLSSTECVGQERLKVGSSLCRTRVSAVGREAVER